MPLSEQMFSEKSHDCLFTTRGSSNSNLLIAWVYRWVMHGKETQRYYKNSETDNLV